MRLKFSWLSFEIDTLPKKAYLCHFRRVRQNLSRMTNMSDNLDDCFSRLWMMASPIVRAQKPKGRKKRFPKPILTHSDELVKSFFC